MREQSHPADVERSDADPRLVVAIAAGIGLFLLAVPFLVMASYPDAPQLGHIADAPQPPAPRLQVSPETDLVRLHARDDRQLGSFGWVDREGRIARMPIDRAMKLLVERGWPSTPAQPTQR